MEHVTEFPREVIEYPDMGIVLPDGTRLSARVWMPKDATENPVPVILEHLPYRKRDGTIVRDQFSHPWMAGHGYCCIRTDMRGSGESEGMLFDEYTEQELQDACDVIAWASAQPWCNGNVGMQGISWGGFNSLEVAFLHPPALKAIITICSTTDRYADDIHYKGGCLLVENFGWSANMLSYSSRPPDPMLVGDDNWERIWLDRLENQPLNWGDWHRHQHRDAYWKHGSVCEDYSAIQAAVLSVGGWHDGYRNTISHLVENLSAPVKGLVGPWNHKYPHYAGPKPAIGFLQESKRWWDHWLKGENTGVENDPAYRVYEMDSLAPKRWFDERPGRWIAEDKWPSANIDFKTLHLRDGQLSNEDLKPQQTGISSPHDCGVTAGEYFPFAFSDELPDEQTPDDFKSACFMGEATEQTVSIVGAPRLKLSFSADKSNAQLAVRLCDLRPDGTSAFITHGVLNLTHFASHETPEPLMPNQIYQAEFALDQIAYRLPKGHKLQVAISTSYWPTLWPSPETAEVTIHEGQIEIPLRKTLAQSDEWEFEKPVGAPAWRAESLRSDSYTRTTKTDPTTGVVTIYIDADSGENRDLEHGLISGSWFKEEFHIHPDDPCSARAKAEWEQTGGREGQMWRTHVMTEMWSDQTNFYTQATLKAFRNEELIFDRDYKDQVERGLV